MVMIRARLIVILTSFGRLMAHTSIKSPIISLNFRQRSFNRSTLVNLYEFCTQKCANCSKSAASLLLPRSNQAKMRWYCLLLVINGLNASSLSRLFIHKLDVSCFNN